MEDGKVSIKLQDLYLTGVTPNLKDIGVGAYGRVFEVEFCGAVCAAKEIHPILVQGVQREEFEATKRAFLIECIRSSSLGHPNIVTFLGIYYPDHGDQAVLPVLVMERMHDSLKSAMEKYPNIPLYVKLSILSDVSRGLWYLHAHQPPIVHRDLSPNNILLTSHFVAKISDLGVAKVIQADSKKTKTRAPGTVDFMPPEALLETPEYGAPLDIFSYGGVILHVVNQEWPVPLHYVMTDPKTGKILALSEVERRQQHIEKMTGTPADLRSLVEQCLDNQPSIRPPISAVSERMERMKEVESVSCPHINMNPITWQQIEQETAPTAEVQQQAADSQVDIFEKEVIWKELAPLPVCRNAHTAVLLGGVVYVGGGFEVHSNKDYRGCYRLDVYNLATNQWSPSPVTTPFRHFAMAVLNDELVIAGGAAKNNEVIKKVLVLNAGQWRNFSEMPTARVSATAVGYHSMLIVVGGQSTMMSKSTLSTTELLDTINGCWYTCNDLPSPHQQMKVSIMNDKLYLLGGFDTDIKPSSQVFVASLNTLSTHQLNWQSIPNTPWCASASVVLYNKFLLTIGGIQSQGYTAEVSIFIPSTSQWKYFTNIPAASIVPAAVGVADSIVVIGGISNKPRCPSTVWIGVFE